MDYLRGTNGNQVMLFPESVEDYITADNPVRFIDAFVAPQLDIQVSTGYDMPRNSVTLFRRAILRALCSSGMP